MIKLGHVPLEGDAGEKGDYMGEDTGWGVSDSSHTLGIPAMESNKRNSKPLAGWRASGTSSRAVGSLEPTSVQTLV